MREGGGATATICHSQRSKGSEKRQGFSAESVLLMGYACEAPSSSSSSLSPPPPRVLDGLAGGGLLHR